MKRILSPSLLSADFLDLRGACNLVENSLAQWVHLDIMDGSFVPNISYGMPVVSAVRQGTTKVLDVHLMIERPERYIEEFARCGADIITVHQESTVHLHRVVSHIKSLGKMAGVSLCPATSLSTLDEILPELDLVLIMSVNPGFAAQRFIDSSLQKIQRLREMIDSRGLSTLIEVDGGVTVGNAQMLFEAGADALVAGSAVFNAADPLQAVEQILGA